VTAIHTLRVAAQIIAISVYVCLCVLSVCLKRLPHVQISRNFLYMLPVAVSRFFTDDSMLLYVLPVYGWRRCFT